MDQRLARRTVLIVEDDPLVRGYMTVVWQELGWKVFEAANAELALEVVDRNPGIDVAFTDIFMPGSMDGIGLARRLTHTHPKIRVILTSGIAQEAPDGLALLKKPWSLSDLEPLLGGRWAA
jgi:CheY-like chemotaxis protein